ncbi:hypothetical protein Vadar_018173 [Vaccinium darrowii]|uniref:Uncharacterized protein n=1 Tax=Vaccinium darrowii TaxID=229202 RepID=A0ACB7YWR9_9ERIC|nr:hypothetical protein Vadar_018173 [Vaccinium darrowii]
MNTQGDAYYTNLLSGQINLDHDFNLENLDHGSQYVPIVPELGFTAKKPKRGGNFMVDEDVLLISAWLNISLDPVQGNEQKHKTYWRRVWEYFHEHKTFDTSLNETSLMCCWSTIQLAMNKFCGFFAQIEKRNESGKTEKDRILDAKNTYKGLNGYCFSYEHCWNKLRFQPKWVEDLETKKENIKKTGTSKTGISSCALDSINLGDVNGELEMPIGRKAAKEQKNKQKSKASGTDETNSPTAVLLEKIREDKVQMNEAKKEMFEKTFLQEQERLKQNTENMRMKQLKEEERIMSIDTSKMPPLQVEYIQRRQMEILGKKISFCFRQGDAKGLIEVLNGKSAGCDDIQLPVLDILQLCRSSFDVFSFVFVGRTCTAVALELAKMGCNVGNCLTWIAIPPLWLWDLVCREKLSCA